MTRWPLSLFAVLAFSTAHADPPRKGDPAPKPKPTVTATAVEKTRPAPFKATIPATASTKVIVAVQGLTAVVQSGGSAGQPPPPPPKGWPHAILTATSTSCARDPGPNEVIVYRDSAFTG